MTAPVLVANARTNRWLRRLAAVSVALLLLLVATTAALTGVALRHLTSVADHLTGVAVANKANGDLLVDCVTPSPSPPAPPHPCWERLHDPTATSDAVALIVDNIYCDQRRAQAKLPAVSDPTTPCRYQTPAHVYPGGTP